VVGHSYLLVEFGIAWGTLWFYRWVIVASFCREGKNDSVFVKNLILKAVLNAKSNKISVFLLSSSLFLLSS
jgi:hypothetical protein